MQCWNRRLGKLKNPSLKDIRLGVFFDAIHMNARC